MPMKNYSSGMVARIAFALSLIHILLEDKNSGLLDDASIFMLRAFREGMFIGSGTPIPVSRYTDAS